MSNENRTPPETAVAVPWEKTAALFDGFPSERYNRLLPTVTVADVAGDYVRPRIEIVKIDATLPTRENNWRGGGEVYRDNRMKPGEMAFTRRGLQKFQHAAGIQFPPQLNRITSFDASHCAYAACGALKKADGSLLFVTASKVVDLGLEELKARATHEARARKDGKDPDAPAVRAEIEAKVRRDMIQARENMAQNAETKAQNRVTRKALALRDTYTAAELAKPFALIRFDQNFDLSDPMQAQMLLQSGHAAVGQLYGPPPTMNQGQPPIPSGAQTVDADEIPDEPPPAAPAAGDEFGDLDAPPQVDPVRELAEAGYETIKARFVSVVTPASDVARQAAIDRWKAIHAKETGDNDRRLEWAALVLELEAAAGGK